MDKIIKYESVIKLENIPFQWKPKFELYYPDLPGYPIVYVHGIKNSKRVYGFPAEISFKDVDGEFCSADVVFLSNHDLESDNELKEFVKDELENRFGLSDKFGLELIKSSSTDEKYQEFFEEMWKYVSKVFGNYMPFGRLYERLISIVRFVSAFQPKTGRQSEMRMLYNFVSIFGETVLLEEKWRHLHFFIIPTYDDIRSRDYREFPKFAKLFSAMEKIWNESFTKTIPINEFTIRSMDVGGSWLGENKDDFINTVLKPMVDSGKITLEDRHQIERLVDAFNRLPTRASFFISSLMNAYSSDYDSWSKEDFVYFYVETVKGDRSDKIRKTVGISQKVVACFLQQGFGKSEFIPIDTWIGSMHEHALGIKDQTEFFQKFSSLGKLERFFWFLSQAKKTNISDFFDMLWCIRYGDTGNNEIRGANPISCFECKLREKCPSYKTISDSKVLIVEPDEGVIVDDMTRTRTNRDGTVISGRVKGRKIDDDDITGEADRNGCEFICFTENGIPKKIFAQSGNGSNRYWKLRDEFSGYLLKGERYRARTDGNIATTAELISSMESFVPEETSEALDD